MICDPCKVGAYLNSQGDLTKAKKNHKQCEGDCGCQHQTGPGWYVKANEKAPLIQVQSP
jgi:hypothetical protein